MSDNITLPREAVEKAVKAFEKGCPPTCENDTLRDLCSVCLAFQRLRAALVTEQPSEDTEALRRENERLREEIASLRTDAERYRWLREGCAQGGIGHNFFGEKIDAAIDEAMKQAALRREGT